MAAKLTIAVLGAGNGAHMAAAETSLMGHSVRMWDFAQFESVLKPIRDAGGIKVDVKIDHYAGGKGQHFAPIALVTGDIRAAVTGADVVMPVMPAQYHERLMGELAPHLKAGQVLLLNPGGVGGTLLAKRALDAAGVKGVKLAQPSDLLYGGRASGGGAASVTGKKKSASLGVFPAADGKEVIAMLAAIYPEYQLATNVIEAGMGGPGMAVHPLPMLMNAVNIEKNGPYVCDGYDITPAVASAIEAMDAERCAVLKALGLKAVPAKDILTAFYGAQGKDFYETVHNVPLYKGQKTPADFQDRYVTEEVPTQLLPSAELGKVLGVPTPVFDATITLCGAANRTDYRASGWTLAKLGLQGLDRDGLKTYLETGRR
jgi:opine dehydrogenase